jgi:hypothetical protein
MSQHLPKDDGLSARTRLIKQVFGILQERNAVCREILEFWHSHLLVPGIDYYQVNPRERTPASHDSENPCSWHHLSGLPQPADSKHIFKFENVYQYPLSSKIWQSGILIARRTDSTVPVNSPITTIDQLR